jgi:hypothetical protein
VLRLRAVILLLLLIVGGRPINLRIGFIFIQTYRAILFNLEQTDLILSDYKYKTEQILFLQNGIGGAEAEAKDRG